MKLTGVVSGQLYSDRMTMKNKKVTMINLVTFFTLGCCLQFILIQLCQYAVIFFFHVEIALLTVVECREFREVVDHGELSGIQRLVE